MAQTYDPYKLVDDVQRLLEERGMPTEQQEGMAGERLAGAGMLLRGLGIDPAMAPSDTLDLNGHKNYNSRIHGD